LTVSYRNIECIIQVLEKLQDVFRGFEGNGIDPFFVLIGSFVSKPVVRSSGGRGLYTSLMTALSEVILSCPRLAQNAKFLLLPGWITIRVTLHSIFLL
jgi:hypothetical protein